MIEDATAGITRILGARITSSSRHGFPRKKSTALHRIIAHSLVIFDGCRN